MNDLGVYVSVGLLFLLGVVSWWGPFYRHFVPRHRNEGNQKTLDK